MRNELDFWKPTHFLRSRPRSLFGEIQKTMDRAWSDVFEDLPMTQLQEGFEPMAELEETDTGYMAKVDLPGVPKDDVKVELNNNVLHVWGERKEERKETKGSTRLRETRYGRFERYFVFPFKVDEKKIEASYENGVLNIYLPKLETARAQEIKISEGKGNQKTFGKKQEPERQAAH